MENNTSTSSLSTRPNFSRPQNLIHSTAKFPKFKRAATTYHHRHRTTIPQKILYLKKLKINLTKALEKNPNFCSAPVESLKSVETCLSSMGIKSSAFGRIFDMYPQLLTADPYLEFYPIFDFSKVLKYLPSDKVQDVRLYILSLQFWLGGSPDNFVNFVKMISGSYIPALKATKIEYSDLILYLNTRIWHPLAPYTYDYVKEYLNWYGTMRDANEELKSLDAPVVGLILQRSHILTGDESHYVVVIMELEANGQR